MATIGKIEEFDPEKEDWPSYMEWLGHFFTANGINEEARKKAVILLVIGPSAYKLIQSLVSPRKPGDLEYKNLIDTMKKHYYLVLLEIMQRYKFHTRFREPSESVTMYMSELRSIVEYCNYDSTLDMMLHDRLVCGIRDDAIQRRILVESNLKFVKAFKLPQSMEAAAKNMKELHHLNTDSGTEVHRVKGSPFKGEGRSHSNFLFRVRETGPLPE